MVEVVEFGKYIRSLRKNKDLTLVELSQISGVSHPYLSQIENGKIKTVASPDILNKIAGPLGTTYRELMEKAGYLEPFIKKFKYDEGDETKNLDQLRKVLATLGDGKLEEKFKYRLQFEEIISNAILLNTIEEKLSIENFFEITQDVKIYYRDIELTVEDRQRILDMLKLMFPER